ncbi:hypothetical protein KCU65_g1202, partial [Aureobasidium melanogenum]
MARKFLLTALFLTTSLAQTLNVTSDQLFNTTFSSPLNTTLNLRSNYGWSPAVLLQSSSGICPLYAYINCQSISGPNYCCASGTYCAYGGPENHIGCCADSSICSGEPESPYTTVYIPSATATTWWTNSGGETQTGYVGPVETVTTTTTEKQTQTEYVTGAPKSICSTLYAKGGNLPTTAAAPCGLVLVLNGAPARGVDGVGVVAGLAVVNGVAAVLGWLGLV